MIALDRGWQVGATAPGAYDWPPGAGEEIDWLPAAVPGTVASALVRAGRPEPAGESRIDGLDWWFQTSFDAEAAGAEEEVLLRLGGVATVWALYLNGELVGQGESMFEEHRIDVGTRLAGHNELALCCRALAPRLEIARRPRARWRTRLASANLRFVRTSLVGRAPGFSPGPPPIGPWRPVTLQRSSGVLVEDVRLRPRLAGSDGLLDVRLRVRAPGGRTPDELTVELEGDSGRQRVELEVVPEAGALLASGEVHVPDVAPWWPHTHGTPALHGVRLRTGETDIDLGAVGFRAIAPGPSTGHDIEVDGLDLHVNGTRVFARGAVWTPVDAVGLAPSREELRTALEQVADAGMNMLRVPGTGVYESAAFHDLCDELGLLVWQDFMFANFDYPVQDEVFRAAVEREARQVLDGVAGRASLAVLCGNSEVEQQVAMLGLDPALGRGPLFGEILPRLAGEAGVDAVYVPSAPCGGDLPFSPSSGIANYFGVGGYRRPLQDARLAGVRFASECLAFANLPDGQAPDKTGVPRDVGSAWDFEDVRDHYLNLLHQTDPTELKQTDPERYAELSRMVSGEVMAEVMGEWRRVASPCGGGLVLCLRDVMPGAGWGVIDAAGVPKVAYHHLRRALAPVAVWTTDEGLGGIGVHVANDGPQSLQARLRVSLYRDSEQLVDEATEDIAVAPRSGWTGSVEGVLGHFRDVAWAYRFGPPGQDAVVVSLHSASGARLLSQAYRFPVGRPSALESAAGLGLEGRLGDEGRLTLRTRRLAYGVRPRVPGFVPDDDSFTLEPGHERIVGLRALAGGDAVAGGGVLTALNLEGSAPIEIGEPNG